MNESNLNHLDCHNFIAIDVAKGLCHANGDRLIPADGPVCPQYQEVPKCKFCSSFGNRDEKGMGECSGFKVRDWTYAELRAITCENFRKG